FKRLAYAEKHSSHYRQKLSREYGVMRRMSSYWPDLCTQWPYGPALVKRRWQYSISRQSASTSQLDRTTLQMPAASNVTRPVPSAIAPDSRIRSRPLRLPMAKAIPPPPASSAPAPATTLGAR